MCGEADPTNGPERQKCGLAYLGEPASNILDMPAGTIQARVFALTLWLIPLLSLHQPFLFGRDSALFERIRIRCNATDDDCISRVKTLASYARNANQRRRLGRNDWPTESLFELQ